MSKGVARLCGVLAIFSVSVVAIPSSVVVSRVQAAPVTTGSCTAEVDNTSGVTMTVAPSGDCVLAFTRTGTTTWTVPAAVTSVRALVVGGGGAGGKSTNVGGSGGGGAGAMVVHPTFSVTGSMSVVVGAGAAPTTLYDQGANGSSSSLGTLVAIGGGGGGDWCDGGCQNPSVSAYRFFPGANGGSGGGSGGGLSNSLGGNVAVQSLPAGATSYGNKGGDAVSGANYHGAGGGGAGAAGQNRPTSNILPTAGGIGLASDITGVNVIYAAGGGASGGASGDYALGGNSIGGNGSGINANPQATNGVANTGSGGGGAQNGTGGGGGSGIVIVRYSIPAAPSISTAPVITGTARTAATLTSSTGNWSGAPTSYAYQWKRATTSTGTYNDIAAATSSTYVVDDSDVGYFIKVSVIATNGLGSSSASLSSATSAVIDIAPTNTAIPVITGTARTGETLTASRGSWTSSPSASTTYEYQWKRASTGGGTYSNITSATDRTYDVSDADIGDYIKVAVTATNGIGASSAALSAATSVVVDLTDSVVPTANSPVSTATGFTFTISNYSTNYTYVLTTTKGSVSRLVDDVTVTGLTAGESATVTIAVTRSGYKPASKTVTGSASLAATTTTAAPALSISIQAPATTVAQGQISVATVAPTTTTLPVLAANGVPVPTTTTTTTTLAPARPRTVVTTTTVPAIVKNAAPQPPVVDKVDAGQSSVQVDGVKTDAVVTRSNNQMVVTAGSLSATLSGLDKTGNRAALDSNGVVHLDVGDVIKISLGGFKPESIVEVWLFSTPTKLGTAEVGSDGKMSGEYKLPFGIKSGSHRVVVSAKLPNGKPTTFTLGILVGDISTTSTLTRVLIAIPITLAIGFGFLLPTQVRRRRKIRSA
jgi:hypothetical protein